MLWDLIRDFFVKQIFGGVDSDLEVHSCLVGLTAGNNDIYTDSFYFNLGSHGNIQYDISLGDWLSTTATAISITIIVVLCCLFVYKIIKLIGGLIR